MEQLQPPAPPPSEVITYLEFIFLGGTKLTHVLREQDLFEDNGDHYVLTWPAEGEAAKIFKANLLQEGRRVRLEAKVDPNNAVQKVVAEIKKKEAAAQAAVGKIQDRNPAPAPSIPLPGVGTSVPADLWDRSPLGR